MAAQVTTNPTKPFEGLDEKLALLKRVNDQMKAVAEEAISNRDKKILLNSYTAQRIEYAAAINELLAPAGLKVYLTTIK